MNNSTELDSARRAVLLDGRFLVQRADGDRGVLDDPRLAFLLDDDGWLAYCAAVAERLSSEINPRCGDTAAGER